MSEDTKEFKNLIRKRGSIKGQLTCFKNYFALLRPINIKNITDAQIRELSLRIEKLEALFLEFDKCQSEIELLCTVLEDQLTEREPIETQFYSLISDAKSLIESHPSNQTAKHESSNSSCVHSAQQNNVKLPIIKLPSFNGNYLTWLEYRDTFESLIHNNDSIPDINKFHYLRSTLVGSATLAIKNIEFTSQNYQEAWDLLCESYNNKKFLTNNHLQALFSIESITKESHKAIRYLIDIVTQNLRALSTLGQPVDSWDTLIIYMVSSKLDPGNREKWEEQRNKLSDLPRLSEFIEFLRERADILETTQVRANKSDKTEHKGTFQKDQKNEHKKSFENRFNYGKVTKSFVTSDSPRPAGSLTCPLCSESHRIIDCNSFKPLSPEKKISEAVKLNLCLNCLRKGHEARNCRLGPCRLCKQKHNTLLHKDNNDDSPNVITSLPVSMSVRSTGQVLLGTALVRVTNPENKNTYLARALLDAGSQSSFMTEDLKHKIGLVNRNPDSLIISGINNVQVPISDRCEVNIHSLQNSFSTNLKCLIVPQITSQLPNIPVDVSQLNLPKNLELADPHFYHPSDIDLLLGAEIFYNILCPEKIPLGLNMPILQSTRLGWVIAGPISADNTNNHPHKIHCNFTKEINDNLTKFWSLEEIPSSKLPMSADDEFCEEHFIKNTKRLPSGRFSVLMPIREPPETSLGDSYKMAAKRFYNLEKRLDKIPNMKHKYCDFIKEYEDLGHLSKINKPNFGYYLPHHAVIRESSETTKLRVVFDASAKTTSNKSLNDIQCIGPVVQDDLFNILIRFRQHKYIITGDIQKMYRQVEIDESQRNLQLILWRDDKSKPLDVYQLNTVTYGTSSAPYLSTRCLVELANECTDPKIAEIITKDFYMDDLLTGSDSVCNLAYIHNCVTQTLDSACFPMHKFRTNCPEIFKDATSSQALDLSKQASVLGVLWCPSTDNLTFSVNVDKNCDKVTKRTILSNTCKIFDPLGLLSGCTITYKMLLQKLWQLQLNWDDPVPNDIKKTWHKMISNLDALLSVSVPRHVLCTAPAACELHCFVDASQEAYAACVYLRTVDHSDHVTIRLLCAKTRVAPLKPITIPRLELCAALLGARLTDKVIKALRCNVERKVYWSDSTITLGWIKTQPKTLKTFVCNRVNEIHDLTERNSWRHIPTDLNPADMASRGVEPSQLLNSPLWWEGPHFLKNNESQWPQNPITETILPEIKVMNTVNIPNNTIGSEFVKFEDYSSSLKLKRIFAYVYRFINNCKNKKENRTYGSLKENELERSLTFLIKTAQAESFEQELNLIKKKKTLTSSKLLQLSPFVDGNGVLRVGGRLNNTDFNFEKKHPVLLDGKHHFTKLLMRAEHLRSLHAGPQLLLAAIRDQFWPLGGRTLARKLVRQCVICTRFRGKTMEPLMGHLPSSRVTQNYPFQTCGTDFAGPFLISSKKGRGNRITKCYLCIFICFCTKAIHLETVSDLSSNAFISCLRRFISRRGKPHEIFCDNGTNFVGANNELGRALKSSINSIFNYTAEEGIKFHFNPPYSPTFGGLWEAGVKSAKFHLKRIVGNASLTYEELSTLFTQIEAVLNSRPLTPLSPDPHDLSPLTPGHFLIGRPLTSLPAPPAATGKPLKTRYQLISSMRENFWKRWNKEYLSELQKRTKWRSPYKEIKQGDMVVFKEENLPPMKWRLGRTQKLYPGKDGVCRVADFLTFRGTERRALNQVCPLPMSNEAWEAAFAPAPATATDPVPGPQDVYDDNTKTTRGAARARGERTSSAAGAPGDTDRTLQPKGTHVRNNDKPQCKTAA